MSKFIEHPANRPILLRNLNCVYCGKTFDSTVAPTKEHVIGRRFVPRGTLDKQWNLILNACADCNHEKSQLEDDISVITMLPDVAGVYAILDERLHAEVLRRAGKSGSRRTGRPVAQSQERIRVSSTPASGMRITFELVGQPQVDHERLHRLAELHFTAFYFLATYSKETRRGGFPIGPFFRIAALGRSNWGSPTAHWFMDLAKDWEPRMHGIAADGFFKIIIRKSPTLELWSYAVEWNHAMRVLAFAGKQSAMDELMLLFPCPTIQRDMSWSDDASHIIGMAIETPLDPQNDFLFQPAFSD